MKIYYIGVLRPAPGKTVSLAEATDLSSFSFFQRNSISQFLTFFAQTIAERTEIDQRQSVEEGDYVGHVYVRSEGISAVLITDKSYPVRPAFTLLNKICDDFLSQHSINEITSLSSNINGSQDDQLLNLLNKYQNPHEADALMKVQHELDETKIVLQQSIENVLQRGEKLDTLVDKSEALTSSSKTFYKQAKKTNSCCVIM
jgi:synaptobrevin family protein YKT6